MQEAIKKKTLLTLATQKKKPFLLTDLFFLFSLSLFVMSFLTFEDYFQLHGFSKEEAKKLAEDQLKALLEEEELFQSMEEEAF